MQELFTIGYEGAAQDAVLLTLSGNGVETLVDIRELPLSRKPGFSKTALGNGAARYGIAYVHVRALGTPRDIRYRRKIDHDEAAFRRDYLEYLATQQEALSALVARVTQERCCLLCYEANVEQCHRLLVASQVVAQAGGVVKAVHLQVE